MSDNLVIYCTTCQMWFDTKNGWKANKASFGSGIPVCPVCGAVLMETPADKFYESNKQQGRLDEVMTWEWPDGSFWHSKNEPVKELLTVKKYDDYVNDLTREMDKHLLRPTPQLGWGTYLWYQFREDGVAIRYPGATRGHVEYDKDKVITDINIYDDTGTGRMGCYKDSVREAVKQFIGAKIVIQDPDPKEKLPDELEGKQVEIVGHGGQSKSAMVMAALMGAMAALPGYEESMHSTKRTMKECGFFPKYERNVPQYMRPKAQGRNERCNCGSGKKYKKCCGA